MLQEPQHDTLFLISCLYPIALFKAITALSKSSLAIKNWIFTLRSAKPALLILMLLSARADADLASKPGLSIFEPIRQTMAAFSTVTFSKFSSSSWMSFLLKSFSQITIEILLALVALKL